MKINCLTDKIFLISLISLWFNEFITLSLTKKENGTLCLWNLEEILIMILLTVQHIPVPLIIYSSEGTPWTCAGGMYALWLEWLQWYRTNGYIHHLAAEMTPVTTPFRIRNTCSLLNCLFAVLSWLYLDSVWYIWSLLRHCIYISWNCYLAHTNVHGFINRMFKRYIYQGQTKMTDTLPQTTDVVN